MKAQNISIAPKNVIRPAIGTGLILSVPLVAMQFTDEVKWDLPDFIVIGMLLFGAGFAFELIAMKVQDQGKRVAIGLAIAALVLYIWAELAVGIFTNIGS